MTLVADIYIGVSAQDIIDAPIGPTSREEIDINFMDTVAGHMQHHIMENVFDLYLIAAIVQTIAPEMDGLRYDELRLLVESLLNQSRKA